MVRIRAPARDPGSARCADFSTEVPPVGFYDLDAQKRVDVWMG